MIHDKCGCMQGHHIWDLQYEENVKSEKYCVCCEHFFLTEDMEDELADNSIEWKSDTILDKQQNKKQTTPGGMAKGKIRRRS